MNAILLSQQIVQASAASIEAFGQAALQIIAARYTSKNTRRAYVGDVRSWLGFCGEHGFNPYKATEQHAAVFREVQLQTQAPKSVVRLLSTLGVVYKALREKTPQLFNPFDERLTARPPAATQNPHPAVSEEDAGAMLATCAAESKADVRDRAILSVLWGTGVRREFLAAALLSGVTFEPNGEATIRSLWKGGEQFDVRLPVEIALTVQAWLAVRPKTGKTLFCNARGISMTPQGVYLAVKKRAAMAGISAERVKPHGFRAGFITRAYAAHLPEVEIQAAAHHSDVRQTREYNRGELGADVARTIGKLPGSKK